MLDAPRHHDPTHILLGRQHISCVSGRHSYDRFQAVQVDAYDFVNIVLKPPPSFPGEVLLAFLRSSFAAEYQQTQGRLFVM